MRRALIWGAALPILILAALALPYGWALSLVYPVQWLRLARREGGIWATFSIIGKFAEAQGALGYYLNRMRGRRAGLIEYK